MTTLPPPEPRYGSVGPYYTESDMRAYGAACAAAALAQEPQAEPLTDEQIDRIPFTLDFSKATLRDLSRELTRFARAIEAAHGITEAP